MKTAKFYSRENNPLYAIATRGKFKFIDRKQIDNAMAKNL